MASASYTLREIQSLLGLSAHVIRGLVAAGFAAPARGSRNAYRFSFQAMVLLRTASGLQAAEVPPRKIVRALKRLKASLPEELPLSGLRITAVGSEVAVREGEAQRHVESGQLLMDFEVREGKRGNVAFLAHEPSAEDCFERAAALETRDRAGAERAYRDAIHRDPTYADASLNLGCLLCEGGRCEEAVAVYREALRHRPAQALLHYNLGIALEDLQRADEALACYERAVKLEPRLADAHFNAARLHEMAGRQAQAIRHYGEYRRLQR